MGLFDFLKSKTKKESGTFDATKPMFNSEHEEFANNIAVQFRQCNPKSDDDYKKIMTDVFAEELLKNPLLIDKDYKEVFPKIMARAITIYKTQ